MPPKWLDLEDGESVRYLGHPSRWGLLREVLYVVIAVSIVGAVQLTGVLAGIELVDQSIGQLGVALVVLSAIPLVVAAAQRRKTVYVITDEQVWAKTGILGRELDPLQLEKVVDVEIRQSVVDRLFGKGQIGIVNAGGDDWGMHFVDVPNPSDVASAVRSAMKDGESDDGSDGDGGRRDGSGGRRDASGRRRDGDGGRRDGDGDESERSRLSEITA